MYEHLIQRRRKVKAKRGKRKAVSLELRAASQCPKVQTTILSDSKDTFGENTNKMVNIRS